MRTEDMKNVTVRPMTRRDAPEVAAVVARAFEDDPLFEWLLPDASTRLAKSTAMYGALFPRMFGIKFYEFSTTADLAGVAIWAGPEKWEPPTMAMLGAMPKLLRNVGLGAATKLMSAMSLIKKHHPKEPHWYLSGLATDPPHQRTGVGTALITPKLEVCDREHLPAYLETQKAINVPYYERFGFRVTEEIDLPKGGPHLWLMWRDPQ
jgi:ribosomal protein S18 acetylase RimI-like enzyme